MPLRRNLVRISRAKIQDHRVPDNVRLLTDFAGTPSIDTENANCEKKWKQSRLSTFRSLAISNIASITLDGQELTARLSLASLRVNRSQQPLSV